MNDAVPANFDARQFDQVFADRHRTSFFEHWRVAIFWLEFFDRFGIFRGSFFFSLYRFLL